MVTKCDTNCDAKPSYLWLRNGIFYYRVELPRVNGKRRYKRISLHTSNFYEAREKVKQMSEKSTSTWPFDEIRTLYNNLIFEQIRSPISMPSDIMAVLPDFEDKPRKVLSKRNKPEDVKNLLVLSAVAEANNNKLSLSPEDRKLLKEVVEMRPLFEAFLKNINNMPSTTVPAPTPAPSLTIAEVLDKMILKANNCKAEQVRKRSTIKILLAAVNLKLEDDYSKFHDHKTIENISKFILEQPDKKNDFRRKQIACIKELATCGTNIDPDHYKSNVILNLPKIKKTKRSERNPHKPYSNDQLLMIFDPKHNYFKDNPDAYFACLIALYTGARANGAITLQYDDIMKKDGIDCIYFRENNPIKQLKNEASERIVPIHDQLIRAGFLEYVQRNKTKLKAKGKDFIFPRCKTKQGIYNNKYTVRVLFSFFKQIGVKTESKDGFDFHSFRNNASIKMQDAGISSSYINDIIGWEGEGTMEQSYSKHTISQIKENMDKFSYDFLQPCFDAWKKKLGL